MKACCLQHFKACLDLVTCCLQASDINALFGFRLECIERMGDQQGLWAWQRINSLFNWLPLAALIEDRIVCMHGGAHRCFFAVEMLSGFCLYSGACLHAQRRALLFICAHDSELVSPDHSFKAL